MNIVLFETAEKQKYNAGSKARQDALKIAVSCGYKHIPLFYNGHPRPLVALELIRGCLNAAYNAGKGDQILIQYPYSPRILNRLLFCALRMGKHIKKYSIAVLIHDISALRNTIVEDQTKNEELWAELHMMRGCEIIYHNEVMRYLCQSLCPAASYQVLGLFDYLYEGEICQRSYSPEPVVMIAGNLSKEKCGYIYQLPEVTGVRFDLYGANYAGKSEGYIHYRGRFSPEELVTQMDGQFGLVWDGDSIETCGGANGNYLRYNNPHKLSLYIAAGVPVIVWSQSALAEYVEKHEIGISVNSISELRDALRGISSEKYGDMCRKVRAISAEITCGKHLSKLLQK